MPVISVFNQKGGVAKTTTSINLSAALAAKKRKVLLIDTDSQANSTNGIGINADDLEYSLYNLLLNPKSNIKQAIQKTEYKFDLLPSNISLADAEQTLSNVLSREMLLDKIVSKVKKEYDYIIIDCPPSLGIVSINALVASDYIIIPVAPGYFSSLGIIKLIDTYHGIQENIKPKLEILGVLLTKFSKRRILDTDIYNQLKETFDNKMFKTVIRSNSQIEYSQSHRKPIIHFDKKSNGYTDYMNFCKEVIDLCEKTLET